MDPKQLSKLCFPIKFRLFFFNLANHTSWLLLGWARKLVKSRGHKISETWLQSVAVIMICWNFLLGKGVKFFMVHWSLTSVQKCQQGHAESRLKSGTSCFSLLHSRSHLTTAPIIIRTYSITRTVLISGRLYCYFSLFHCSFYYRYCYKKGRSFCYFLLLHCSSYYTNCSQKTGL